MKVAARRAVFLINNLHWLYVDSIERTPNPLCYLHYVTTALKREDLLPGPVRVDCGLLIHDVEIIPTSGGRREEMKVCPACHEVYRLFRPCADQRETFGVLSTSIPEIYSYNFTGDVVNGAWSLQVADGVVYADGEEVATLESLVEFPVTTPRYLPYNEVIAACRRKHEAGQDRSIQHPAAVQGVSK